MLADYHVHSAFSDDSTYIMEDVVKDAIRINLDEICFTEHVDYGIKPDWDKPKGARTERGIPALNCPYPYYFAELENMVEHYGNQIHIKRGLEFGVQMHTRAQFEELYESWPLDFVLLSIHQVDNKEFWSGDFQEGKTQDEIQHAYYQELLDVCTSFECWSVLAHLDLIARYDPYGDYPFEKIKDIVAEILKATIAAGKGIEFNTSYVRYGLSDTQPQTAILKLYRDLGGKIITIGSDSHAPAHLGSYIKDAHKRLSSLGFEGFCTYEAMEPHFCPFDV